MWLSYNELRQGPINGFITQDTGTGIIITMTGLMVMRAFYFNN